MVGAVLLLRAMSRRECATSAAAVADGSPATKDLELPVNILGERVGFQVSTNQAGAWFRLQKFIPSVRTDPWAPVRGLN